MIKIDLITGFLGSGKTTFIKAYAKYLLSKGEKICIIENDYGAVNVDMVLLQDLLSDNCNLEMIVGGDGAEAHRRRFRTKLISMGMSGYERVIIEPSGIYDIDEFFDVLYDEPLDRWYEIGSVITILDSGIDENISEKSQYLLMSESACAGKIVLSKIKDCSKSGAVDMLNDVMSKFGCERTFDKEKDVIAKPFSELDDGDFSKIENCGYKMASYVKLPLEEKQFQSLFYFDVKISEEELRKIVKELFDRRDIGNIIRIKGFVRTGDVSQVEINATREKITIEPVASSTEVLIIIGEGLSKEKINDSLKDYCSVVSL